MNPAIHISHETQGTSLEADSLFSALWDWGFSLSRTSDFVDYDDTILEEEMKNQIGSATSAVVALAGTSGLSNIQHIELGMARHAEKPIIIVQLEGQAPSHPLLQCMRTPVTITSRPTMVAARESLLVDKLHQALLPTSETKALSARMVRLLTKAVSESLPARYALPMEELIRKWGSRRGYSHLLVTSPGSVSEGYLLQINFALRALSARGATSYRLRRCTEILDCVVDTADYRFWGELVEIVAKLRDAGVPSIDILRAFCYKIPEERLRRFDEKVTRSWPQPDPEVDGRGPTSVRWQNDLSALMLDAFTANDFFWWISMNYNDLRHSLPDPQSSAVRMIDLVHSALDLLIRRGLISDDFFLILRRHLNKQPRLLARLGATHALWQVHESKNGK
jgi:hypothetical protein